MAAIVALIYFKDSIKQVLNDLKYIGIAIGPLTFRLKKLAENGEKTIVNLENINRRMAESLIIEVKIFLK